MLHNFFLTQAAILSTHRLTKYKIQCLFLLEGGYTTITGQYCLVLQGISEPEEHSFRPARTNLSARHIFQLAKTNFSAHRYRRLGLCVLDSMDICMHSWGTCSREAKHDCMGTNKTINYNKLKMKVNCRD